MGFFEFFRQKKNVFLITAIASIVLGALTFILATPHAFGPWVTPQPGGATEAQHFLAFIAFGAIVIALAEIILGVTICTQRNRENMSLILPLLTIIASELFLIIVSFIIFGFAEISAFFYICGLLLILGTLTGLIYSILFLKEMDSEQAKQAKLERERRLREASEARAAAKLEKERERERAAHEKSVTPPVPPPPPAPEHPPVTDPTTGLYSADSTGTVE